MWERAGEKAKAFARRILPKAATKEEVWLAWSAIGWVAYAVLELIWDRAITNDVTLALYYYAICVFCILISLQFVKRGKTK